MQKTIFIFLFLISWLPAQAAGLSVDVNTASAEELQQLTGIGPVLAQGIIEARPFYSLDELTRVSRIGPKTLENIKEQGLAWVDPELKPQETITEEPGEDNYPAKRQANSEKSSPARPFPVFLIALGMAGFSGGIILALKKRLEIV